MLLWFYLNLSQSHMHESNCRINMGNITKMLHDTVIHLILYLPDFYSCSVAELKRLG